MEQGAMEGKSSSHIIMMQVQMQWIIVLRGTLMHGSIHAVLTEASTPVVVLHEWAVPGEPRTS